MKFGKWTSVKKVKNTKKMNFNENHCCWQNKGKLDANEMFDHSWVFGAAIQHWRTKRDTCTGFALTWLQRILLESIGRFEKTLLCSKCDFVSLAGHSQWKHSTRKNAWRLLRRASLVLLSKCFWTSTPQHHVLHEHGCQKHCCTTTAVVNVHVRNKKTEEQITIWSVESSFWFQIGSRHFSFHFGGPGVTFLDSQLKVAVSHKRDSMFHERKNIRKVQSSEGCNCAALAAPCTLHTSSTHCNGQCAGRVPIVSLLVASTHTCLLFCMLCETHTNKGDWSQALKPM